ncbi:porin family protein [Allomuricauda sp. F6463D]|uniref:porin family protein n=1 Tax=Allomuricauda sp. F6463D TaxID=2926409 RepID=UPI001FF33BDA|nr:porin family protein [Muricauda sp. F6463D]MCK0161695.1 PorT family protein [Muricauda sp. F6463D]
MKKISLLIALLICVTASAQLDNTFGIKAGTNYSQYTTDFDTYKRKIGYYVGGFFNISISDKTSIRPELLLANQGTKTSIEINNDFNGGAPVIAEGEIVTNINQLMILLPVNFRVELIDRLHLELGLQAGYVVKIQEVLKKVPYDPSLEGERTKYPLSELDRFDFGLNGGLGFDLTDKLELNARYSLGLIELNNFYKTSVISFGLGFKI